MRRSSGIAGLRSIPLRSLGLAGLAYALGLLFTRMTLGQTSLDAAKHFPFNHNAALGYRIDISPVTPDSGINTGYVIAYGHYISPPYQVTVRDCSTYVNGVRIEPLLSQPPAQVDSTAPEPLQGDTWRVGRHLDSASLRILALWRSELAAGLDTTRAFAVAESMLRASDMLVDSARLGGGCIVVFGPEVVEFGQRRVERRVVLLPPSRTESPPTAAQVHDSKRHLAEHLAEVWCAELTSGRCNAVTWGLDGSYGINYLRELQAFTASSDTLAEHWYDLVRHGGLRLSRS
jgi:hypothetical protein